MKYKASTNQSIIVLLIIFSVMFVLKTQFPGKYPNLLNFTTRVGAISSNVSNRWQYKFQYLDGSVKGMVYCKERSCPIDLVQAT